MDSDYEPGTPVDAADLPTALAEEATFCDLHFWDSI